MITIRGERTAAVCCIIIAVYMAGKAWAFPANGNLFPLFICISIVAIACVMLLRTLICPRFYSREMHFGMTVESVKPIVVTAVTVLYVLSMFAAGFYTASLVYFVLMSLAVGIRDYLKIGLVALAVFPLMYFFFEFFLHTGMPRGFLI